MAATTGQGGVIPLPGGAKGWPHLGGYLTQGANGTYYQATSLSEARAGNWTTTKKPAKLPFGFTQNPMPLGSQPGFLSAEALKEAARKSLERRQVMMGFHNGQRMQIPGVNLEHWMLKGETIPQWLQRLNVTPGGATAYNQLQNAGILGAGQKQTFKQALANLPRERGTAGFGGQTGKQPGSKALTRKLAGALAKNPHLPQGLQRG